MKKIWNVNEEKMQEIINDHEQITKKLATIYKRECKGSIVRSRVKWFEEGEKKSKYFLSLEKRNFD